MNKCFNGKDHDFESNENSEYCSNGCGEKESEYLIKRLSNRVKELEGKLEKAVKVIEFYADGDSWGHESPSSTSYSVIDKEDMGIGEFNLNELTDDDRVGGLRARKFLEENK